MAVQLTKIGNSPNVPVKEFICDTAADVEKLPEAPMGSTAFCIEKKKAYMKGSNGWQEI